MATSREVKRPPEFLLAIARGKAEIRELIEQKGYINVQTELQPIIDTIETAFPKARHVDVLGMLNVDYSKVRYQRFDIHLHRYSEVSERRALEDYETGRHRTLERAIDEEQSSWMQTDPMMIWLKKLKRRTGEDTR